MKRDFLDTQYIPYYNTTDKKKEKVREHFLKETIMYELRGIIGFPREKIIYTPNRQTTSQPGSTAAATITAPATSHGG